MLDDDVVAGEHVEVEVECERVGVGGDAGSANEEAEVGAHVEAGGEAGGEQGDGVALAAAGADVVICECIETRARRADFACCWRVPGWERGGGGWGRGGRCGCATREEIEFLAGAGHAWEGGSGGGEGSYEERGRCHDC